MAYSTGTSSSMADLMTALQAAAVAAGWTLADGILASGDCHIKLTAAADSIEAAVGLGKSGASLTTPAPSPTYMRTVLAAAPITFPVTYHIHAGAEECYLVANWSTSYYAVLAFGQSPIAGGPGTGVWIAGTAYTSNAGGTGGLQWTTDGTLAGNNFGSSNNDSRSGLFLVTGGNGGAYSAGCYVHHGLTGWSGGAGDMPKTSGGIKQLNALDNPSTSWNGQTMLVPIQPWIDRGSGMVSLVADLKHARYVRLDNLDAGDSITLGPDEWRVYPVYRKDAAARGGGDLHSGTYGYALRV